MGAWVRAVGFREVNSLLSQAASPAAALPVYIVEAEAEYAPYVELGTRRMEARPFMRNAAAKATARIGELVPKADTIEELIRDVAMLVERIARSVENTPHQTGNLRRSIKARRLW